MIHSVGINFFMFVVSFFLYAINNMEKIHITTYKLNE